MNVIDCAQGTPEWLAARVGRVTASRVADALAKIKGGESGDRRNYKAQLVAEILTGQTQESSYLNDAMRWGIEQEPLARAEYEVRTGRMVTRVGLVLHPTIERGAASPDGLVDPDGLVEIKCPNTATHLDYLLAGAVPPKYVPQMLWQMACTGRSWCDFVSYDPRLPEHLQLFVKRFPRDDYRIKAMEIEVQKFLAEVGDILNRLPKASGQAELAAAFQQHDA